MGIGCVGYVGDTTLWWGSGNGRRFMGWELLGIEIGTGKDFWDSGRVILGSETVYLDLNVSVESGQEVLCSTMDLYNPPTRPSLQAC